MSKSFQRGKRYNRFGEGLVLLGLAMFALALVLDIFVASIALGPQPIMATGTAPASTNCQYTYLYEPPWQGFGISYSGGYYKEPIDCSTSGGGTYQYVSGYSPASPLMGTFLFLGSYAALFMVPLMTIGGFVQGNGMRLMNMKGSGGPWGLGIGLFVFALFLLLFVLFLILPNACPTGATCS